jgi:hypothetical protein
VASYLVVIYGASPVNYDAAWTLARELPGKTAVLSVESLLSRVIARPDQDATAELDMAHTQLRLLVANYMRNGYNVVVEGVFYYQRDGRTYRYEQDIDQVVALMRNMTRRALTLHLETDGDGGFDYRKRYGANALVLDASHGADAVAQAARERLMTEELT